MEARIKIKIKKTELDLSLEEAKELAELLTSLTGEKEVAQWYRRHIEPYRIVPPYTYTEPYWTNAQPNTWVSGDTTVTYCGASGV